MFLFLPPSTIISRYSFAETNSIFAKITSDNTFFYSLPDENDANILFLLPRTYFVKLLSSEGENFYYAQYDDIFGYIKKSSVKPMNGVPKNPYATSNFRVFSLEGIGLYKKPSMKAEKLTDLPYLCQDLIYYGCLTGDHVVPDKSNTWYYAKFTDTSTFGYVYSVFCDKLPKFSENSETFDIISSPLFTEDYSNEELSPVAMTFIIIGVSLPCLIVLYLLVKPNMKSEKLTKPRPKLKAKRKHDYFEFDEGDLT